MKNYINIFCLFALASLLQSCICSAYDKRLNAGYYLSAMDVKSDMEISYKDEQDYVFAIVNATVFAVGQNNGFIIAKQHPKVSPTGMDKAVINFFIIPLKNKVSQTPEKNVYGPLTLVEFEQRRKKLNIENIDFTIVFNDLE